MPRLILAAVNPDNTPHGYNLTFAFPMLLFIIIGGILYLLFSRPHRRVPARTLTQPARAASAPSAASAPKPEAAQSADAAASGAGSSQGEDSEDSAHAEDMTQSDDGSEDTE